MTTTGGCYCGAVRYAFEGPMRMRGLCLCHTCQMLSGGAGNLFFGLEAQQFHFTQGDAAQFTHPDKAGSPTRTFCGTCGTQLTGRSPRAPAGIIVRAGTLDDPAAFTGPQLVVWTSEAQPYHQLPHGIPSYPQFPRPPDAKP